MQKTITFQIQIEYEDGQVNSLDKEFLYGKMMSFCSDIEHLGYVRSGMFGDDQQLYTPDRG